MAFPSVRELRLGRGGCSPGQQGPEPRNMRHAAERRNALERGPERRLVGIDCWLAGFALDRLDRLDLRRIGAAQEETVGRNLRVLARERDPARDRYPDVLIARADIERDVTHDLDAMLA